MKEGGKSILVVVAEMGHNTQREIVGVTRFAKRSGLSVDVVEGRHFGEKPDFAKWIEFWNPGGLIVDPEYAEAALADKSARALPLVVWDAAAATGLPSGCARAMNDSGYVADAAARELLETGFRHFAFVPALDNPVWSRERGAAFAKAIAAFGRQVSVFSPASGDVSDAVRFRAGLSKFLAARKKPFGVFAANDATAALVRNECAALGLRIPQDVALVGVDDSPVYCERGEPTLTSVRLDLESGGAMVAEMLADMMDAPVESRAHAAIRKGAAPRVVRYGVERVVRRESTRVLKVFDGRVFRALEWIRHNACSPIGAADVVAVMGCSRRMADLSFRRATGHTILDEIHSRRLEEAKTLLKRDDVPIEELPTRLGYDRGPFLGILFRRTFGCSMRQWRKKNRR